jgi:hypothetical protein
VSDKSPRQTSSQKSDKSIKEKRAIKKAKKDDTNGSATAFPSRHGAA